MIYNIKKCNTYEFPRLNGLVKNKYTIHVFIVGYNYFLQINIIFI